MSIAPLNINTRANPTIAPKYLMVRDPLYDGRLAITDDSQGAAGSFSDCVGLEVAAFGVKVCTLEPSGIRTNFSTRAAQVC
jgi:hypothetical protein